MAQAAIATIATLTELWCGKMVVVSRNTANPEDGQDENTTLVRDTSIHLTLVHALVTPAAHMITLWAVLVTRALHLVVRPTQVQWLTAIVWVETGAFCTLTCLTGLFTASNPHMAQAAIATIATLTVLLCGKMVVVSPKAADPVDGPTENITQLQGGCIPRMSVHVLVTAAVVLTPLLEAIAIHLPERQRQLPQPQPQPQRPQRCMMSRW